MLRPQVGAPGWGQPVRLLVLLVLVLALWCPRGLRAQDLEDYYAKILEEEVEVVDPVKRPMLFAAFGVTNFLGEIQNPERNFANASWAVRGGVAIPVGKSKQLRVNVAVTVGKLRGEDFERSYVLNTKTQEVVLDQAWYPNTSFSTMFYNMGLSLEYNFWHLTGTQKTVRPFVSVGAGLFVFTPKGNFFNDEGNPYYFWRDGTVRLLPEHAPGAASALPVRMDDNYETDLKKANIWGLNNMAPISVVFPLEVGLDFYLTDRISFRVSSGLHYVLSDMVDGYDRKVAAQYADYGLTATAAHDMFLFTNVGLNLDLFSESESFIVDKVWANIKDFDYEVFFSDQDDDGVIDRLDECPDTPPGVAVDSVGCPLDSDGDGVPDYLDKEPETKLGLPVDSQGQALTDAAMTLPVGQGVAVRRKDVKIEPVSPTWSRRYDFPGSTMPEKFRACDLNGDGMISFDEVIRAVDDYFAGQSELTPDDIYELNAYFFSQH